GRIGSYGSVGNNCRKTVFKIKAGNGDVKRAMFGRRVLRCVRSSGCEEKYVHDHRGGRSGAEGRNSLLPAKYAMQSHRLCYGTKRIDAYPLPGGSIDLSDCRNRWATCKAR